MQLFYRKKYFPQAQQEAQALIDQIVQEMPAYVSGGTIDIRMAWKEDGPHPDGVRIPVMIPEAELLFNGELVKKDLLDLILLDLYALQMAAIRRSSFTL